MSGDPTKGMSLRTGRKGRPAISAPMPISGPVPPGKTSLHGPPQRPQPGGKISDLIKRRYSTRFTNLPSDFDATVPPIPSVPALPTNFDHAGPKDMKPLPVRGAALPIDSNVMRLMDPRVDVESLVNDVLGDASELDISLFTNRLNMLKDTVSLDIQRETSQNKDKFIAIGKEAKSIKGELSNLGNLLSELKVNITASSSTDKPAGLDDSSSSNISKRDKLRSDQDDDTAWAAQLETRIGHPFAKLDPLVTLTNLRDGPNTLIDFDGKQRDLRWMRSQVHDLDRAIALQQFEDAVARVEKFKDLSKSLESLVTVQDLIKDIAGERAEKLAGLLTYYLVESHELLTKTKKNVDWLARLGFEDRARVAYLQARTQIIKKRHSQCVFHGDFHRYIWEVSFVYFMLIKKTVSVFEVCFPQEMMSACVSWALEQVQILNIFLKDQLSSVEHGGAIWTDCMNQAKEHAKLLADVHMDLQDLVGQDEELGRILSIGGSHSV
ncbi:MAG: exocyst complex component exo84 [Claussenomyces sp. TS43310]|nr:MAG: exocyst complex component exo84 [Claussenomyces sp. TS43310]